MQRWIVAASVLVIAGVAMADDYPDVRGTWQGTSESVGVPTSQFYANGHDAVRFSSAPVTLVIEQQEGRRFAGAITIRSWTKPVIGVLSGDTLRWTEPGGLAEAELTSSDTMDYCYFRIGEYQQLAACAELERQP